MAKTNSYSFKKDKTNDTLKRNSYIKLKYNLDKTIQEISKIKNKKP